MAQLGCPNRPTGRLPSGGDLNGTTSDTIAFAWRDSTSGPKNWDVHLAVSTDGGISWQAPKALTSSPLMQSDPQVVVDKHGGLFRSPQRPRNAPFILATVPTAVTPGVQDSGRFHRKISVRTSVNQPMTMATTGFGHSGKMNATSTFPPAIRRRILSDDI
ncbi:MAG: hypothetical protein IPG53_21645 [Ignavibacteriales bacterium]|nr:hypothetical protein [Ignavibacteriales bacterium]